jgi:hypothetical protein
MTWIGTMHDLGPALLGAGALMLAGCGLDTFGLGVPSDDAGSGAGQPVSIPHPSEFFGWDPYTFDPPPTSTVDDVPTNVAAGDSILVTGTGGATRISFSCTKAAPCMLKGQGQTLPSGLVTAGTHYVVDGFVFAGDDSNSIIIVDSNFAAIRNITHSGNNTKTSNGTSMISTGSSDIVYFQNHIHDIAVKDGSEEVDYIGIGILGGSRHWITDNEIYGLGADSLKLGRNVGRAKGVFPTAIYVQGNRFYGNGENPIDIKWSTDIFIVDNELFGVTASVSSSGEAIVIHESADRVTIANNDIHDVSLGIVTATSGGGAEYINVSGNKFRNMDIGVYNRGGGHADITNNTFDNVEQPIRNNSRNGSTISTRGNTDL